MRQRENTALCSSKDNEPERDVCEIETRPFAQVTAKGNGPEGDAYDPPVFVSRHRLLIDKQFRRSVPREKRDICNNKINELVKALDEGKEDRFLQANDGKPMKGAKNVYKFRVTHADRIIYVHSKEIPHLRERYSDSIVLLRYVNHDEQGLVAARTDRNSLHISEEKSVKAYQTDFRFTEDTPQSDCDEYFREMVSNVIDVSQLKTYIGTSAENFDVLLSAEQYDILNTGSFPLVIYGCAGSGKTVLSVHLIYNYAKSGYGKKVLYTSLSENLNTHVEKLFSNIAEADAPGLSKKYDADFLEVNELFRNITGTAKSGYSDFISFKEFMKSADQVEALARILQKNSIDDLAVWSEIRGIIKGHLDEEWGWSSPISRKELPDEAIRFLSRKKMIASSDQTYKYYIKADDQGSVYENLLREDDISVGIKEQILSASKKIDGHFSAFDNSKRMLKLDEYLNLNPEYSVYSREQRTAIHKLCVLYDHWLVENHRYDDNDLARSVISSDLAWGRYDLAVLDEVQDFTEMQIFALFKISRNPSHMVFAGDIHQVINPTFFSEERLKKLYYSKTQNRLSVDIRFLRKNYRSQDKIVDFANALSEIRKRRIGSRSLASELSEESAIEGWRPFLLNASDDNIRRIVNRVNELPYAAVVVQDSKYADKLKNMLESEYTGNIFTVQEIKGLEKRYVVCLDIVSAYTHEWAEIFSEKNIRKNMKFRYYFNILYVAVTRAQDGLCLVEKKLPEPMQDWLLKFADAIDSYDSDRLFLDDDDNAGEHWYQSAEKAKENKDYERAILQYKKSQYEDFEFQIKKCRTLIFLRQQRIYDAIRYCADNDEFSLLELIAKETDDAATAKFCRCCAAIMTQGSLSGAKDVLNYICETLKDDELMVKAAEKISYNMLSSLTEITDRLEKEAPHG